LTDFVLNLSIIYMKKIYKIVAPYLLLQGSILFSLYFTE